MLKHALMGGITSAAVFGLVIYCLPSVLHPRDQVADSQQLRAALPTLKPPREAAAPPGRADIEAVVRQTIKRQAVALPTLQERFMEEPVDPQFAATQEPEVWGKVSKLPGVESALVQCRTYHCKVTVTGKVEPGVSLDVPGLTYRGEENGALVFLYNPDLAAAE